MQLQSQASTLAGRIQVPSSKSQTLRAILFASMAHGQSTIVQVLDSPDAQAMCQACLAFGANIEQLSSSQLRIDGCQGKLQCPADVIYAGNSGLVLRFITALASLAPGYTVVTGDASVRYRRLLQPLLQGLSQLGVHCVSTKGDGFAPVVVRGPLLPGAAVLAGEDSQPVSALLTACALAVGEHRIEVRHPGETAWVQMTLDWFDKLGVRYSRQGYHYYHMLGSSQISAFDYTVPGDFGSALFPMVAALITGSTVVLQGLSMQETHADKQVITYLQEMGARIVVTAENELIVSGGAELSGGELVVAECIDAVPILAVLGCFTRQPLVLVDAAMARHKESDRLSCITMELRKMGAKIEETAETLTIYPSQLHGACCDSHADHRIALALAVAAMAAKGVTQIRGAECIQKTYPAFIAHMQAVGARLEALADE